MWRKYVPPELHFIAQEDNSTIKLLKFNNPNTVNIEISTDGSTWTDYTFGDTITLTNVGDIVCFRNKSNTQTGFSINNQNRYNFAMTGSIAAAGDVNYLLCKNSTTDLTASGTNCFYYLFINNTSLTTTPKLSATTLTKYCYQYMFYGCTNITTLPKLPATILTDSCYQTMFYNCSKIKVSETQIGEYQNAYRIPTTGTGTAGTNSLTTMFASTGGTFTGTPTINTTYYTSNQVI